MLYKFNESMLDACVEIFYDVYTSSEFNFNFLTKENTTEYFRGIYKRQDFDGFVFTINKKIVGVCLGKVDVSFGNKLYEITEICVKDEYRGQGIGKAFMREIETYLKKQGFICINLNTKRNINAYQFYLNNGFAEKTDVVCMMKNL